MSIIKSVADMFRTTAPVTPNLPKGTADTPDNKQTENTENKEAVSPLDQFKDFWQTPKDGVPGPEVVDFKADPAKLLEAANKIDFRKVAKPEQLAAIQEGGEKAAAALVEIMQAQSATLYAQNMFAATKIAENAAAQVQANFEKQLPALLRKQGLGTNLIAENKDLAHPALQPMIEAMQSQLATKYPNASAAELLEMSKTYMTEVGKVFAPQSKETKGGGGSGSTKEGVDWSKYLTS